MFYLRPIIVCLLVNLVLVPDVFADRAVRPAGYEPAKNSRHALVIGNSAYTNTSPLRNPVNDAEAISTTLREMGFSVNSLLDADQRTMEAAITEFGESLKNSKAIGLFYYAGHGMQVEGENYLFPVDVDPKTAADVRYDTVPVGKVLGQMDNAANGMNIVILDACRNNPFARGFRTASQGLAQVIAPAGSFISYATAPGQVAADGEGNNGLFTSKLLKHMRQPGLKLEDVFKQVRIDVQQESNNRQVPWDASSLTGEFYFIEPTEDPFIQEASSTTIQTLSETLAEQSEDPNQKLLEVIQRFLEQEQHTEAGKRLTSFLHPRKEKIFNRYFWQTPSKIQYELAQVFRKGLGQAKDDKLAFEWFQRAASATDPYPKALTMLGYLYQSGTGTVADPVEAGRWYQRGVDKGQAMSMFNLGMMYLKGKGVREDAGKAEQLIVQAAQQGNQPAQQTRNRLGF